MKRIASTEGARRASSCTCPSRCSAFPRLRRWLDDWRQAPAGVVASVLLGQSPYGGLVACAGVEGLGTFRRGEGTTRTAALLALESNMDTVESYGPNPMEQRTGHLVDGTLPPIVGRPNDLSETK